MYVGCLPQTRSDLRGWLVRLLDTGPGILRHSLVRLGRPKGVWDDSEWIGGPRDDINIYSIWYMVSKYQDPGLWGFSGDGLESSSLRLLSQRFEDNASFNTSICTMSDCASTHRLGSAAGQLRTLPRNDSDCCALQQATRTW